MVARPLTWGATCAAALLIVVGLMGTSGSHTHAEGIVLPELGRSADRIADDATERRLGQAFLRQLQGSTPLWPDASVHDYIEQLTYRLARHTPLERPQFSFVVVDDRSVNAFAVPGGVLGINTGLILVADTEGEVAGVMAHELGHLSQRHFARQVEAGRYNSWIALGGLLASIAAAAAGGGSDLGVAAAAGTQALAIQNRLAYSRSLEQEADRLGMTTLTAAGYDPRDMPSFFLKLQRATRQLGFLPEFLLTHPLSASRITDLERRVSERAVVTPPDDLNFRLVQTRLRVAYTRNLRETLQAGEVALTEGDTQPQTRFALVLGYLRDNQLDRARAHLDVLLSSDPMRRDYQITAIDLKLAQGQRAAAWQAVQRLQALYPNSRAVLERHTRLALMNQQVMSARAPVEEALRRAPNDLSLWRQLADIAAAQGDAFTVFRARGELLFFTQRQREAEQQMALALRQATGNYSLTVRVQQRLEEMRRLDAEFR